MSEAKEIDVVFEISPDGSVKIDVVGAQGPSCKQATAPYEALLSGVKVEELKDEYHSAGADSRQRAGT